MKNQTNKKTAWINVFLIVWLIYTVIAIGRQELGSKGAADTASQSTDVSAGGF
jgi:hypothetical protein